jgi:hypothetical protein
MSAWDAADPTKYLLDGEDVYIRTRRHWMVLFKQSVQTIVLLLIAFGIAAVGRHSHPAQLVAWVVVLAALLRMGWHYVEWWHEKLLVTKNRVLLSSGWIAKKVDMMPLAKITDMTYNKPVLGRIFGYGSFILESAGQVQALERLDYLPRSDEKYVRVCELLFGNPEQQTMPVPEPRRPRRRPARDGGGTGGAGGQAPPRRRRRAQPEDPTSPLPRVPSDSEARDTTSPAGQDTEQADLGGSSLSGSPSPVRETNSSRWIQRARIGL